MERSFRLHPHPRPKCQVSSRGGGGLRGLPSRAALAAKSTLPIGGRGRARIHSCTITLIHFHTLTRVHIYTRSDLLPRPRRRSLLAARTFRASRRAGRAGRGSGSAEIDNRFGGLQRISLLEGKPHKPNPLSTPRKIHPFPELGTTGTGPLDLCDLGLPSSRLRVSQRCPQGDPQENPASRVST